MGKASRNCRAGLGWRLYIRPYKYKIDGVAASKNPIDKGMTVAALILSPVHACKGWVNDCLCEAHATIASLGDSHRMEEERKLRRPAFCDDAGQDC